MSFIYIVYQNRFKILKLKAQMLFLRESDNIFILSSGNGRSELFSGESTGLEIGGHTCPDGSRNWISSASLFLPCKLRGLESKCSS